MRLVTPDWPDDMITFLNLIAAKWSYKYQFRSVKFDRDGFSFLSQRWESYLHSSPDEQKSVTGGIDDIQNTTHRKLVMINYFQYGGCLRYSGHRSRSPCFSILSEAFVRDNLCYL